jgi:hypothetical protein
VYGLRKDTNLSFLMGREVQQVAIGDYEIIFGLDGDIRISVESEFGYFDGQREWVWRPEPGASLIAAHSATLLGATIQSYEGRANGTLVLAFPNGRRLTVLDSNKEFESYDITRPGQTIVV